MNKKVIGAMLATLIIIAIILFIIIKGVWFNDKNALDANIIQITNEGGVIRDALLSPDGSKIVYHVDDSLLYEHNNQRLYVIDVNGENKIELDSNSDMLYKPIYITPNNESLFYQTKGTVNYTQIFIVDLYGKNNTKIALLNNSNHIVFCSGLHKLAYSITNWNATENYNSTSIWLMDSDGKNRVKLVNYTYPYYVASLQFNSENNNLIYSLGDLVELKSSGTYISYGIYSINISNLTIVKLCDFGFSLEISPSGDKIILGETPGKTSKNFWIMSLDDKNISFLDLKNKNIVSFDFTHDGNKILVNSYPLDGLWIINSNGTNLRRILNDDNLHYFAFFSPDDDKIYYHSITGTSGNIFIMENAK